MEAFKAIENRASCRSFSQKTVAKGIVEKLIDAGRRAPTANNLQPVEFVAVTNADKKQTLAAATDFGRFIDAAPVCLVVLAKDTKYYLEDGCAAVENILIAAAAEGLGACWVAGDKKRYADQVLNEVHAPKDYKLIALIPIGRPAKNIQPRRKKPLTLVLHWEMY